ncbi:MAG: hypothetical protein R2722_17735 [Tessaracoccus sp.]
MKKSTVWKWTGGLAAFALAGGMAGSLVDTAAADEPPAAAVTGVHAAPATGPGDGVTDPTESPASPLTADTAASPDTADTAASPLTPDTADSPPSPASPATADTAASPVTPDTADSPPSPASPPSAD